MKHVKKKRFLTFFLIASLIVPLWANTQTAEAKAAKIQTGAQSIGVNCSCKIAIGNKAKGATYSFASSNVKIASVNKNGKVTGKDYGTAKITVSETKGKTTKKLGTVKITVQKCALDAAVKKGVCAFGRGDGSGVFAGGKGGKTVKNLAQIEGLLVYQNPKAVYQYVSDTPELLDINAKGKIVGVKGSGTVKITVSETYNGKTRKVGTFKLQVAPDKKIVAYETEIQDNRMEALFRYVYDIQGRQLYKYEYDHGRRCAVWETAYDRYGNYTINSCTDTIQDRSAAYRFKYAYENGIPTSVELTSGEGGGAQTLSGVCTADESGRVTLIEFGDGRMEFAYNESGNLTRVQETDGAGNIRWEAEYTYTEDGQIKSRRFVEEEMLVLSSEQIPLTREDTYEYHFDGKGYAVSCDYAYQFSSSYYETFGWQETYSVKGMELSEYFARLRADETRDSGSSAIVGRWRLVIGFETGRQEEGELEFFADGRVEYYESMFWEKPDASGRYPVEDEGEVLRYEINGGELTIYDKAGDYYVRGHYLLTGKTILFVADDHGG